MLFQQCCFLHCFSPLPTRHFAHQEEVNFHTTDCYVCFLLTTRMYCQLHLHCILMFIYGDQLLTLYNHNLMIYWHPCELFPEHQYFKISNACVHCKSRLLPLYLAIALFPVADLGGIKGVHLHPLWRLVMYFCVNNWTSPSNDYAAVACSNNNQAQLHTHVSVPYWSPDVWLGLELLWGIQLGLNNSLAT